MANNTGFYDTVFAARANQDMRMVLAGKTGEGKSAMGNALLGQQSFIAKRSMKSETSVCLAGERKFEGRRLIVVDTPGLFDTNADPNHVAKEIGKEVMMSSPGSHCFIITNSARNRFTEEAQQTVDLFCKIFGGNVLDYCIVVFTNEDAIIDEDMIFEKWLPEQTSQLHSLARLIDSCNHRCMAINSKSKSQSELDKKVRQLVSMIQSMVAQNNGRVYTNDMYKQAEAAARQREEEKLRMAAEKDAEIRREMENLRRKAEEAQKQLAEAQKNNNLQGDALKAMQAQLNADNKAQELRFKELIEQMKKNTKLATAQAAQARQNTREDTASKSGGWWDTISNKIIPINAIMTSLVSLVTGGPVRGVVKTAVGAVRR